MARTGVAGRSLRVPHVAQGSRLRDGRDLTLAIGIGATTAIYSVVDTILLRPLPFADSDRLVRVIENVPLRGGGIPSFQRGLGWQEFLEWRARTRTLSESVGISPSIAMVGTSDGTARLWGSATSATTFTLLGTRALLGTYTRRRG